MADFYASESGGGSHDGSSEANAWAISEINWSGFAGSTNTLYLAGTILSKINVATGPGPGNRLTISGNVAGNPGELDGQGVTEELIYAYQKEGLIIEDLGVTNIPGKVMTFNNCHTLTIRRCDFHDSAITGDMRGIWIFTPKTGTAIYDIEISENTFTDFGTKNPDSNSPVCIYVSYNVNDGNYIDGFVVKNNWFTRCNNCMRINLANVDVHIADDGVTGLEIDGNIVTDCEHAFQQIHWRDGSGAKPSFIANNSIKNTGSGGNSGTKQMNVIQIEAAIGGSVYNNTIDGWEKLNGVGDGHAIILDWKDSDPLYACDGIELYGNTFLHGGYEQTENSVSMDGINMFRSKDCIAHSNLIVDCRGGLSAAGQTIDPTLSQGNKFHNNTIIGSRNIGIKINTNAQVVDIRNNILQDCATSAWVNSTALAPTWDYNALHNNTTDNVSGPNDIAGPLFLSTPDYQPGSNSPVIGAGDPSVLPLNDFLGAPYSNPPSIGAYAAAAVATGQIDVQVKCSSNWQGTNVQSFVSKWDESVNKKSWMFRTSNSQRLEFRVSEDGTHITLPLGNRAPENWLAEFPNGKVMWVRATWDQATSAVQFYYKENDEDDWTPWGGTRTLTSGLPHSNDASVELGSNDNGTSGNLLGNMYKALVYDEIDGTLPVIAFDASDHSTGSTITDPDTGLVWTLHGNYSVELA